MSWHGGVDLSCAHVCPGAGKTNIAMIAVLREVGLNMRYGVIQKGEFKIVYVAPMKALAAEVTSNFSKRLEPLGEWSTQIHLLTSEVGKAIVLVHPSQSV